MKNIPLSVLALAFAGALVAAPYASASGLGFARVVAAYAQPTEDGVDAGGGAFVQMGGAYDEGELMLEAGQLRFDQTETVNISGLDYRVRGSLWVTPLLATARWRGNITGDGKLSALAGFSGGVSCTRIAGSVTASDDSLNAGGHLSKWVWTYGVDVGLSYRASERIEILAGYKFLCLASSTWSAGGIDVNINSQKAHIIYAGLGCRF